MNIHFSILENIRRLFHENKRKKWNISFFSTYFFFIYIFHQNHIKPRWLITGLQKLNVYLTFLYRSLCTFCVSFVVFIYLSVTILEFLIKILFLYGWYKISNSFCEEYLNQIIKSHYINLNFKFWKNSNLYNIHKLNAFEIFRVWKIKESKLTWSQ